MGFIRVNHSKDAPAGMFFYWLKKLRHSGRVFNSPKYQIDAKECEHDYTVSHNACGVADLVQQKKPFVNQSREREKERTDMSWQIGQKYGSWRDMPTSFVYTELMSEL